MLTPLKRVKHCAREDVSPESYLRKNQYDQAKAEEVTLLLPPRTGIKAPSLPFVFSH